VNIDDSRIIARFQSLLTESLAAKRLGQSRPELIDETARLRALRLAPDAALKTPGPAAQTQPPDPWDPTRWPVHEYILRAGCSCACRSDT
jgi:hypothetical protein